MAIFSSLLRRVVGILGHAKASFTEANNLMEKKDDTASVALRKMSDW